MIKKCVRGDASRHAFGCDVCRGVTARAFLIDYEAPEIDERGAIVGYKEKRIQICNSCVREFMDAIISSRMEET